MIFGGKLASFNLSRLTTIDISISISPDYEDQHQKQGLYMMPPISFSRKKVDINPTLEDLRVNVHNSSVVRL